MQRGEFIAECVEAVPVSRREAARVEARDRVDGLIGGRLLQIELRPDLV